MDPPDRVSWVELLAEYRRRNHKSGYRLVDPKRGALHAKCRQLGVLFNSKDVWLTSTQQEQLLSSLVPEHVVDDPSMIFYFECVGHHRRRTEITKDGCRLKTENEADFHRTAPYDRLLCIFHVGQARHINLGHLLTRLMTDLGEEFIDTQKWVEWCADTRLTADTYFFLSEDEYEQIRDYVRREPTPPEPSPSVDAPAPPDSDPPGDDSSEEPPVQEDPPEPPAQPPSEEPGKTPETEGASEVTDYLDEAKKGLPSRIDEEKAFVADLKKLIAAGQHHNPNLKVVAVVNGKVVGDADALVDAVTPVVKVLDGVPADEIYVRDADALTKFLTPLLGDEDPTKKAVKTAWNA